jgi:hypothetical protein
MSAPVVAGTTVLAGVSAWPRYPRFIRNQHLGLAFCTEPSTGITWGWFKDDERYVIVVNLSDCRSEAQVRVPWADARGGRWTLVDIMTGGTYERDGDQMSSPVVCRTRPFELSLLRMSAHKHKLDTGGFANSEAR